MILKQKINSHLIKELLIQLEGDKPCHEGSIKVNGKELRKGIGSIELRLSPSQKPEIFIEYAPSVITKETSSLLDLKKISDLQRMGESEK